MITLYHGSSDIIEHPVFGQGNPRNDYGLAFYCTESAELSKEWASYRNRSGYSNKYSFDDRGLSMLDLTSNNYSILSWITILIENRTFDTSSDVAKASKRFLIDNYHIDIDEYDFIKGYRADDSYFSFAQDFINGSISVSTLSQAMKLGKLGEQIAIRSERAFGCLKFEGYDIVDNTIYHNKRVRRDSDARAQYRTIRSNGYSKEDLLITHLIDWTVSNDDTRLF